MKPFLTLIAAALVGSTGVAAELASQTDLSLLLEAKRAQQRGIAFLVKNQEEDGSWRHHPAITGLAIKSILSAGADLSAGQQAAVDRGVKFILANVKPNGAIYGANDIDKYPNYSTAICAIDW